MNELDLMIIGAGPAGLAAAVEAQRGGLSKILVLEKGPSHSQMIRTFYKEGKRVDAQYAGVEAICFGILCLKDGDREGFLQMMDHVIEHHKIPLKFNTEVWSLTPKADGAGFVVKTTTGEECSSRFVVVAIGKMGKPRQPDYFREIPGLLKANKTILFDINTRPLSRAKVMVVGGGDSAIEYAQMLSEKNDVTLSYRQAQFTRLNSINAKVIQDLVSERKVRVLMPSNILRIEDDGGRARVVFADADAISPETFDAVMYGLGGMTPVEFLRTAHVELDSKGEAKTNDFHESTSVPGLYIVGDLLGRGRGGGSIISGFNTASEAIRDLLSKYLHFTLAPEFVSLEHLPFSQQGR